MPARTVNRDFEHKRLIALSAASTAFPPSRLCYPHTPILQHSCLLLPGFSFLAASFYRLWLLAPSPNAALLSLPFSYH